MQHLGNRSTDWMPSLCAAARQPSKDDAVIDLRQWGARSSGSRHMNMGPAVPIGFGAADDFAGHRCDFPNTEEQEPDQIRGRITFSPFEVDMRQPVSAVPHSEQ